MARKPETVAELVTDLVSQRPMTGFEIARELETRHRIPVRGREGAVYAALIQLERDGWISAGRDEDGRRCYSIPLLEDAR